MNIHFDIYGLITTTVKSLPYVSEGIPAGFPSPAADYIGDRIDLNEVLILSPGATYYARVRDYYLVEEELEQGDGILFDTRLAPRTGDLAFCEVCGCLLYTSDAADEELIPNPISTFFGKVRGISLIEDDIEDSDSVIVDRMLEPRWGDLAVCVTSEGFTMKYVEVHDDGEIWLMPGNKDYAPIRITGENERLIWGIVTHSIRQLRTKKGGIG